MSGKRGDALRVALEEVSSANGGRLTASAALARARNKKSKIAELLPPHFWDDAKCSERYRLHWMRAAIRSVRLIVTVHERPLSTVFYVRDPAAERGAQGYVETRRLRGDAELAREALLTEFGRIASLLERAYALAAALNLENEVEGLRGQVEALRRRATAEVTAAAH